MQDLIQQLASELDKDPRHVENVVRLLDEGNTIPFIARYRKELHGAMDDTALRNLEERLQYLRNLAERREAVKRSIEEQGKLTEELSAAIDAARTLAEVEDLYRPYKQKRRTRATIAREKGLAPLAELLFAQGPDCPDPTAEAARYVDAEKGVETVEDALSGASDIIAETISDDDAPPKTPPTLSSAARPSAPSWSGRESSAPRRRWRRTLSTGCTTTSPRPSPGFRVTRSWPSTGGRRRAF